MASIFSRIYSYRQQENKNNKENYLIEIFAFCMTDCLKNWIDQLAELIKKHPEKFGLNP